MLNNRVQIPGEFQIDCYLSADCILASCRRAPMVRLRDSSCVCPVVWHSFGNVVMTVNSVVRDILGNPSKAFASKRRVLESDQSRRAGQPSMLKTAAEGLRSSHWSRKLKKQSAAHDAHRLAQTEHPGYIHQKTAF